MYKGGLTIKWLFCRSLGVLEETKKSWKHLIIFLCHECIYCNVMISLFISWIHIWDTTLFNANMLVHCHFFPCVCAPANEVSVLSLTTNVCLLIMNPQRGNNHFILLAFFFYLGWLCTVLTRSKYIFCWRIKVLKVITKDSPNFWDK